MGHFRNYLQNGALFNRSISWTLGRRLLFNLLIIFNLQIQRFPNDKRDGEFHRFLEVSTVTWHGTLYWKQKKGGVKKTGHLAPGVGWFMGRFEHGAVIDLDFTLNKIETVQILKTSRDYVPATGELVASSYKLKIWYLWLVYYFSFFFSFWSRNKLFFSSLSFENYNYIN